jgi:hypothetical protein
VPDPQSLLIFVAIVTLLLPVGFLVAVAYAAGRRRRGLPVSGRLSGFLTILGGMSIGVFLLTGADVVAIVVPILAAALLLAWLLWQRRRRVQAGQIIFGASLPWTLLWGSYAVGAAMHPATFDIPAVELWFGVGAFASLAGLFLMWRGDPQAPPPDPGARAGEPGSRSFGNITAAIRDAGRIGPFGTSELAALTAFVIVWFVVPLFVPAAWPRIVGFVASVVIGSIVATEAYIRAIPNRSRRAWEAFSWLGEHDLREAGDSAADPIPTTRAQAEDWLARHPDTPDSRWVRVEVLELAGRFDEARAAAAGMPDGTPSEHWAKVEAQSEVEWHAGGDSDIAALRAAAEGLQPPDGDERLRAEVSIAAAEVRRRMADGRSTPGDAIDPLIEVRGRLGHRADGQIGRALRRRMLALSMVIGLTFGTLLYVLGPSAGQLF